MFVLHKVDFVFKKLPMELIQQMMIRWQLVQSADTVQGCFLTLDQYDVLNYTFVPMCIKVFFNNFLWEHFMKNRRTLQSYKKLNIKLKFVCTFTVTFLLPQNSSTNKNIPFCSTSISIKDFSFLFEAFCNTTLCR